MNTVIGPQAPYDAPGVHADANSDQQAEAARSSAGEDEDAVGSIGKLAYWLVNAAYLLHLLMRYFKTDEVPRETVAFHQAIFSPTVPSEDEITVAEADGLHLVKPIVLLSRRSCTLHYVDAYLKEGLRELQQWTSAVTEEYAGGAWDQLQHIRQAVEFISFLRKLSDPNAIFAPRAMLYAMREKCNKEDPRNDIPFLLDADWSLAPLLQATMTTHWRSSVRPLLLLLAVLLARHASVQAADNANATQPAADDPVVKAEKEAGDIVPQGACKAEITAYCSDLPTGNRSLERCLSTQVKMVMAGKVKANPEFTAECLLEIRNFKIALYKDISMNKEMGAWAWVVEACEEGITLHPSVMVPASPLPSSPRYPPFSHPPVEACKEDIASFFDDSCLTTSLPFAPFSSPSPSPSLAHPPVEACKEDIASFCDDDFLYPEPGNVLACLRESKESGRVSDQCAIMVFEAQEDAADDFRMDPQLNMLCSKDADTYCGDVQAGEGRIQECLVSAWGMNGELLVGLDAADDFRMDLQLNMLCSKDADTYFGDVQAGEGRIQEAQQMASAWTNAAWTNAAWTNTAWTNTASISHPCTSFHTILDPPFPLPQRCNRKRLAPHSLPHSLPLHTPSPSTSSLPVSVQRRNRKKLNWECQAELFRQEVENADDIRLNVRLFRACLDDKRRFCPDVLPGDARVKDCLEEHRSEPEFSKTCKAEFDKMMERRAVDFRLDASLRKYCHKDIVETCYPDAEDISDVANWDSKVMECLQDYKEELKDPRCRQQVHRLTKRAAEDIRFDHPLHDACQPDQEKLCKDVPPGHARVFTCLQDHRKDLRPVCRAALFDQEIRYAGDIDFKFAMRQACADEMKRLCSQAPDMVKCLQDHVTEADMSKGCADEVKKDEERSAQDFRLNFRLNHACFEDVQHLCMNACAPPGVEGAMAAAAAAAGQACGGAVLKCLSEKVSQLQNAECREEVFYFERRQVEDPALDVPLQQACKDDADMYCGAGAGYAGRDHSRTLSCLRQNRKKLSAKCKAEELRFTAMEASDIRLTPTLMNACGLELHQFCRGVPPMGGHAFRCLQWHIQESGMSVACRAEVDLQTMRQSQYYRTDIALQLQCDADVADKCSEVDEAAEMSMGEETEEGDYGPILRCLLQSYQTLKPACQSEVTYVVRNALWMYHSNAPLTKPCHADIDALCNSTNVSGFSEHKGAVVGVFGQCLVDTPLTKISDKQCRQMVGVVAGSGGHVGGLVNENQLEDTLTKIAEIQLVAQAEAEEQAEGSPLVLTGWLAFIAITALAALLLGGGFFIYRRYFDPRRNYTVVVKAGDV
ncbi:unnamed protein product [Closterium sp. Yama58-4]|nr:unnamed protein product [Closterium sp. Yama58-4]